jgi:hypothetical protein
MGFGYMVELGGFSTILLQVVVLINYFSAKLPKKAPN